MIRKPFLFLASALAVLTLAPTSPGAARTAPPTLAQWAKSQGYVAVPLRRIASNHQVVEVTINGKPALFLLDSGAAGTVIDRGQLGAFEIGPALRSGDGVGAGGSIRVSLHPLRSFRIGGHSAPLTKIVSTDLSGVIAGLRAVGEARVTGVVGQDVLTRFFGLIDVGGGKLYLKIPR